MKIFITGIAGYLGLELAKRLSNFELIGLDIKEKPIKFPNNVQYFKKSILDLDLPEILNTYKPEVLIHLAWTVQPVHKNKLTKALDLDYNGTKRVLESCVSSNVKHIIFMSSTLAYGALKDNPSILSEEFPLRAKKSFHYAYHKKLVEEEILNPFIKENPQITITILRPPGFLGSMANNYVANILRSKILPVMIGGRNTKIQFLHVNDLISAIDLVIQKRPSGIYNLSPDTPIIMKDVPTLLSGHKIYLPESLARLLVSIAWFFHFYQAPSSYLDFVRYEFLVSNEKIKTELGWSPKYSTELAILSLINKIE